MAFSINSVIDNFIRSMNGRAAVTQYYNNGTFYIQIQSDIGTFESQGADKDKVIDTALERFHAVDIRKEKEHVQNAS